MSFLVGRYKLQGTPDKLLATLRQAQVDDKVAEKRTSRFGCTAALAFAIGFGSVFFEAFRVSLGMGAIFVVCAMTAWYWSKRNVDDRKIEVPLRFLEIARADLPPTSLLNLELDFRPYHNDRCRSGPETYAQTWMTLKGKLSDGNRFKYQVEWIIRRREKAKHRGRKVKERLRDRVTLGLRVNPRSYPSPQRVNDALVLAPPPAPLLLSWARPVQDRLEVCLTTPPQLKSGLGLTSLAQDGVQVTGDTLLGALVWMYRGLKVAKAGVIAPQGAAVPAAAARAQGPRGGSPPAPHPQAPPPQQGAWPQQSPPPQHSAWPQQVPPPQHGAWPQQAPPPQQGAWPQQAPPPQQGAWPQQAPPPQQGAWPQQAPPPQQGAWPQQAPPPQQGAWPQQAPPSPPGPTWPPGPKPPF